MVMTSEIRNEYKNSKISEMTRGEALVARKEFGVFCNVEEEELPTRMDRKAAMQYYNEKLKKVFEQLKG